MGTETEGIKKVTALETLNKAFEASIVKQHETVVAVVVADAAKKVVNGYIEILANALSKHQTCKAEFDKIRPDIEAKVDEEGEELGKASYSKAHQKVKKAAKDKFNNLDKAITACMALSDVESNATADQIRKAYETLSNLIK